MNRACLWSTRSLIGGKSRYRPHESRAVLHPVAKRYCLLAEGHARIARERTVTRDWKARPRQRQQRALLKRLLASRANKGSAPPRRSTYFWSTLPLILSRTGAAP